MRSNLLRAVAVGLLIVASAASQRSTASPATRFGDDFETGLDGWEIVHKEYVRLHATGDEHGRVLALKPGGDVLALVADSAKWGNVRIQGEVYFPTAEDNYLGVVYGFRRRGERSDFGVVYIKGNDSYLQANPFRDFNVGRTLYPEYRVDLTGPAAIQVGRWQRFRVDIVDGTCAFYVGETDTPQMVFPHFEGRGRIGLQPRSVGDEVWVDNVKVEAIQQPGAMESRPRVRYSRQPMLTSWQVAGPFTRTNDAIAEQPAAHRGLWQPFSTDARGAVVTGKAVDYHGPNTVAYFRTTVSSAATGERTLHLSTIDDLALWVNGRFHWFVPRGPLAWFDFFENPTHQGQRIPVSLTSGSNELVLRVRGGVYASGGFFARIE